MDAKTGIDRFVATFSAVEKDSGEVVSYCTWAKGVLSLLPGTQKIALAVEQGTHRIARWEKVQAVVGRLMRPQGMHPERYLVDSFPTDEQLEAIRDEPL